MTFLAGHAIEIVGLVLGLFYLYFEYHASTWVWLFSLLMPMVSMVVYFDAGLYADFSINIYYLLASAYGLVKWRGTKRKKGVEISHISTPTALCSTGVMLIIWLAIYVLLHNFTNSTVPVMDALTTAVSIVGTWMLARKYIEQWIAWILVDAVCVGLYIYKDIPFYAALYAIYTVVAIFGYRKWRRLMSAQA
ncbi:MAG: nicotinamide riboside transporter PnuC [Muribaculaceae bacterium]|nr:nicotinamide riboside transporter PnuC [Muribaculaceae bacterium]MDE6345389.1 nicotinamide riboside transporter PnuC [Muribaculaceae bacterium]